MGCGCEGQTFKIKAPVIEQSGNGIQRIASINYSEHTPHTDSETQEHRLEICRSCEFYTKILNKDRCSYGDGSFLRAKVSLIDQTCPHPEGAKW
jgi:hypothetical protein